MEGNSPRNTGRTEASRVIIVHGGRVNVRIYLGQPLESRPTAVTLTKRGPDICALIADQPQKPR